MAKQSINFQKEPFLSESLFLDSENPYNQSNTA
jgi:hypothetical protein